jgi:peptide/nickel transport system permease protein
MASNATIAKLEMDELDQHVKSRSHWQRAMYQLSHDYLTLLALGVVVILTVLSIMAPQISTYVTGYRFDEENLSRTFSPPSYEHALGTDEQGRDHLTRLIWGGQVSLGIAFFASILSLTIGVTFGLITGYYGGIVDDLLMWFITTLNSIPSLFLLLIISSVLGPSPVNLILVLGFLGWTGTMRLVRGETFTLREREFIVAARAMGASNTRIMASHILPNIISIVIITLAIDIGVLILVESGLSFLGFGIPSFIPSWGNMLTNAQAYFQRAPHLVIMPGVLITITVLCLYVIGDGLRDAFDPTVSD